jgi:hypothetical protein
MSKRHRAIVDAVKAAVREGIKGVHIRDDERVSKICASITSDDGALRRPDLMYDSFVQKRGKLWKYYNLTEITCPWAWGDSLERAYQNKFDKYEQAIIRMQQEHKECDGVGLNIIVVSPSGVFLQRSQKDFAVATMLPRSRLAAHARFVVDAAITQAHEHYGTYCKAYSTHEMVRRAHSKFNHVEQEFKEEADEMEVTGSIREVEVVNEGEPLSMEDGEITSVELRRKSEIDQKTKELIGLPAKPLHPHPDGYKEDGADGKDHKFGEAYVRQGPKEKPKPGGVRYIKTLPMAKVDEAVEQVDVCFGFKGNYIRTRVPSDLTHEDAERLGCAEFNGDVGLIEFRPPTKDLTYRSKAMYCKDRDNAVWTKCGRTDTSDEEWILL